MKAWMNWFVVGQGLGVVCALVVVALVAVLVLSPSDAPLSGATILALGPTVLLAAVVVFASLQGSPGVLLIAFVASFIPIGLYSLGNPSPIRWVGVAELGYLVAAAVLYFGGLRRNPTGERPRGEPFRDG